MYLQRVVFRPIDGQLHCGVSPPAEDDQVIAVFRPIIGRPHRGY